MTQLLLTTSPVSLPQDVKCSVVNAVVNAVAPRIPKERSTLQYAPRPLPVASVPYMLQFARFGLCDAFYLTLKPHRSSVPLLGLAYSEFQYVLHRERQRKAAQTRLARHQARVFMGVSRFLPALVTVFASVFCTGVPGRPRIDSKPALNRVVIAEPYVLSGQNMP